MIVVHNENNELIPTFNATEWGMSIEQSYYCFLDEYSSYNQIIVDLVDQEKTTFTCPFGVFAYHRMPFGLCDAPTTFQRCMLFVTP